MILAVSDSPGQNACYWYSFEKQDIIQTQMKVTDGSETDSLFITYRIQGSLPFGFEDAELPGWVFLIVNFIVTLTIIHIIDINYVIIAKTTAIVIVVIAISMKGLGKYACSSSQIHLSGGLLLMEAFILKLLFVIVKLQCFVVLN